MSTPIGGPKTASEIMTQKPHVFTAAMTVTQAAAAFLQFNFSSAPVLNADGSVMGILDETAVVRIKLTQHLDTQGKDKLASHADVMKEAHFVKEDEPILEVIKKISKAPTQRLLVRNNADTLVGVISPKDILRYVVGDRKKTMDLRAEVDKIRAELATAKTALTKAIEAQDAFKAMVLQCPVMLHSFDENGRVTLANKKMHDVLGYREGELIGKSLEDLYADTVQDEAKQGLKRLIAERQVQTSFTTMLDKNGAKMRVELVSVALVDETGKFRATISASRPIDADILLRALHGVLAKDDPSGRYSDLKNVIEKQVSATGSKK